VTSKVHRVIIVPGLRGFYDRCRRHLELPFDVWACRGLELQLRNLGTFSTAEVSLLHKIRGKTILIFCERRKRKKKKKGH